jgi:hypothetical protein
VLLLLLLLLLLLQKDVASSVAQVHAAMTEVMKENETLRLKAELADTYQVRQWQPELLLSEGYEHLCARVLCILRTAALRPAQQSGVISGVQNGLALRNRAAVTGTV